MLGRDEQVQALMPKGHPWTPSLPAIATAGPRSMFGWNGMLRHEPTFILER